MEGFPFAVNDVRATAIMQSLSNIQVDVLNLGENVSNQDDIVRLHDRLDHYLLTPLLFDYIICSKRLQEV